MERFYDAYRYDNRPLSSGGTHWESEEKIRENLDLIELDAPFYPTCGLPMISNGRQAYVSGGDSHGLIMGSTGSKKTRLFVQPMMHMIAKAGESVICTDPKGELYQRTSGLFHQMGYHVQVFNLRDPARSYGWNPLRKARKHVLVREYDKAGSLIDDLAVSFFPRISSAKADPFWQNMNRALFTFLAHMVVDGIDFFPNEEVSFKRFQSLLDHFNGGGSENNDGVTNRLAAQYPKWSRVHMCYSAIAHGSEKTYENILASYHAETAYLFSNARLLHLLSVNDLEFESLGTRKTALYIIMPDEKTTYHPLVSLMVKRVYEELIGKAQKAPGGTLPVRVNFMLDEFCNLPEIPDMSAMISAARSRNVRFYLVVQSLRQLEEKYGSNAGTIRGNCNDWAFLTSRELALLEELSSLCGTREDTGKPLITVSQLQRLDKTKGETLLMCGRLYPFISQLADIDEYCFEKIRPVPFPAINAGKNVKRTEIKECLDLPQKNRCEGMNRVDPSDCEENDE